MLDMISDEIVIASELATMLIWLRWLKLVTSSGVEGITRSSSCSPIINRSIDHSEEWNPVMYAHRNSTSFRISEEQTNRSKNLAAYSTASETYSGKGDQEPIKTQLRDVRLALACQEKAAGTNCSTDCMRLVHHD